MEETPDGVERKDHTGEVAFYTLILKESNDYWVEFKAIYYKGELKELILEEWKFEDNKERKSQEKVFSELIRTWKDKEKKWWFIFYKIYLFIISGIFSVVRYVGKAIIKVAFWIEKRIT